MKNRNLKHQDDWATPPYFYEELDQEFGFDFDPCPFMHDKKEWDGLRIEWGDVNFMNPPYNRKLKERFVKKALKESRKGKVVVMLLPVSTSTKLFHEIILPNYQEMRFVRGRIPFIGINTKGHYVNWHLWSDELPEGVVHVKNNGQSDSMIIVF